MRRRTPPPAAWRERFRAQVANGPGQLDVLIADQELRLIGNRMSSTATATTTMIPGSIIRIQDEAVWFCQADNASAIVHLSATKNKFTAWVVWIVL